jgi:prevent-host-death family protein
LVTVRQTEPVTEEAREFTMHLVMSAADARIHFGEVIRKVADQGETIVVERAGKPQVVIMSVAEYERLGGGTKLSKWLDEAETVRTSYRARVGNTPLPDIDELIDAGRDE